MFSFLKYLVPEKIKKWVNPNESEDLLLELTNSTESETYTFDLIDKSKIRSIHYYDNNVHFCSNSYEKFVQKFNECEKTNIKNIENEIKLEEKLENFIEYKVKENETLFGISLNFNVNLHVLEKINLISEDTIYPNQIIKIPIDSLNQNQIQEETKIEEIDGENIDRNQLFSPELNNNDNNNEIFQFNLNKKQEKYEILKEKFYYCTSYGQVQGIITMNPYLFMFDPSYLETKQQFGDLRIIKFQACIDLCDIKEAFLVTLPSKYCDSYSDDKAEFTKDFYLQLILNNVGNESLEKNRYYEKLLILKKNKEGFATTFFRLFEKNDLGKDLKNQEKLDIIKKFITKLNENIESRKKEINNEKDEICSTMIPFYDILFDKIKLMIKEERKSLGEDTENNYSLISPAIKGFLKTEIYHALPDYIPSISEDSRIFSKEMFIEIINFIPSFLRLRNWKLTYSNWRDGMSLNTNCEDIESNIIIVKDFKNCIFGGFCSDGWKMRNNFYGTGESFLFTFKDIQKIHVYKWTSMNYDIMLSNSDGLAIGCGERYGFYIDKDLYKGNSYHCDTFNNDILSIEHDFDIQFLEIWALDEI